MSGDPHKLLQEIVTAVKSIRDLGMREARMIEKLQDAPAEQIVAALRVLVASGGRGDIAISLTIAALVAALGANSSLPYGTRAELYAAASEMAATEVSYLLLMGEPESSEHKEESPHPIAPRSEPMPLGIRKSVARTRNRQTLSHLIHDPSPQVVEILLGNPDLRETEVLTMASKRPASEDSLQRIAMHPRWSQVRRIRLAVALNASCPLPLACRLCLDLRDQDLHEVRRSTSLAPHLRAHAERVLHARQQQATRVRGPA